MWELARDNSDVLRMSTLVTSEQVNALLANQRDVRQAIEWCKRHAVTHVYLESFRSEIWADDVLLQRSRDAFRDAGFLVSGCLTPSKFGKRGNGWPPFSCFTSEHTRTMLQAACEHAARFFDVIMIDDFLCSDCSCDECRSARGMRSWAAYKRAMMCKISRDNMIEPARRVNPRVEFIIKYPAWYEMYQERGYDVRAQSDLFAHTWAGTETRGEDSASGDGVVYAGEPQFKAYWIMRWLKALGGGKCGGGWHDSYDTSPRYYVEQNRQAVLGGAPEVLLFNYGNLSRGWKKDRARGPENVEALRLELPLHFELARIICGRRPRGLLGWKPANSDPGPDWHVHPLLGMAGFPVTGAASFDPGAEGFVFGCHVTQDPAWWDAVSAVLQSGRPVICTEDFPRYIQARAEGNRLPLDRFVERAVVLPRLTERNRWPALEAMPRTELDSLRRRAMEGVGDFSAPFGVSLYLFGDDVAVLENFLNVPVDCTLRLDGWSGMACELVMPNGASCSVGAGEDAALRIAPRTLVALRRRC